MPELPSLSPDLLIHLAGALDVPLKGLLAGAMLDTQNRFQIRETARS
jgi:hypothetical protein